MAEEQLISRATLRRAHDALGIRHLPPRAGERKEWHWALLPEAILEHGDDEGDD